MKSLPFKFRNRMRLVQHSIHERFQVKEEVNSLSVENTTVYIDTAAPSHMVSDESYISKHVVENADCSVRIKRSCGTSSATEKGLVSELLKITSFQFCSVDSSSRSQSWGDRIFGHYVGREGRHICGIQPSFDSSGATLRNICLSYFDGNAEGVRLVIKVMLDGINLNKSQAVPAMFRTEVNAGVCHRRMDHCCNPCALQQLSEENNYGVKFTRDIDQGDCCQICFLLKYENESSAP